MALIARFSFVVTRSGRCFEYEITATDENDARQTLWKSFEDWQRDLVERIECVEVQYLG